MKTCDWKKKKNDGYLEIWMSFEDNLKSAESQMKCNQNSSILISKF